MAQPRRITAARKAKYLQALSEGASRRDAAEAVGIHPSTARRERQRDPDFAAAVENAELDLVEEVEYALVQAAMSGNVRAIEFLLTNRSPSRWKSERNLHVTANVENARGMVSGLVSSLRDQHGKPDGGG